MKVKGEPIWVPCEGSGDRGHRLGATDVAMCRTCGEFWPLSESRVVEHKRDDLVARIERGDFN